MTRRAGPRADRPTPTAWWRFERSREAVPHRGEAKFGEAQENPAAIRFPRYLRCASGRGARGGARGGSRAIFLEAIPPIESTRMSVETHLPKGPVVRELILLEPRNNLRLVWPRSTLARALSGRGWRPAPSELGAPGAASQLARAHSGGEFEARPRESKSPSEPARRPLSVSPGGTGSGGRALASP